MRSVVSSHIDKVVAVGLAAAPGSGPEAVFHRSWARCLKQHGLDPTRPTPARILPSHQLRDHQQRMDGFMRVARAGMEDLYGRVADLGYMLLLTDAEGITVDYIGNPASEQQLKAAGLYIGADWNEAHAGTCGVGTCLVEQATITCHQVEHFDATHIALTCTSAPLHAPNGDVLGVLDVSALHSPEARESQHLVRHLASMYAQLIEDANFLRSFARQPVLRLGRVAGLVEVSGELMLAFDHDGVIVGANTGARRQWGGLGGSPRGEGLIGRSLAELLDIGMDALRSLLRSGTASLLRVATSNRLEPYHALVLPPRAPAAGNGASAPGLAAPLQTDTPSAQGGTIDGAPAPLLDRLCGNDTAMTQLVTQAKRLVDRQVNLLICGETGAGKEVLARALHAHSRRAAAPFVAVNCAAIPESLIESELFGYTPGSFTGGKSKGMKGLIAQSDGGTLFLDEIGDMPLALQTRLLRVLSESEVLPLGAERPTRVRLNVIAATHRDLREQVDAGRFRQDLYYRLCAAVLQLPALRERQDRRYLIETLFAEEAQGLGSAATLGDDALQCLLAHDWPGNLRELRNALRLAVALSGDGCVSVAELPPAVRQRAASGLTASGRAPVPPQAQAVAVAVAVAVGDTVGTAHAPAHADADATRLLQALKASRWNITAAAAELAVCRATVYRLMKRHGITQPHLL